MSNDTTAAPEAQSQVPAQPTAGDATPAAPENHPSLSHEEQLDQLSPESLDAAARLLSPDRQRSAEGVDGGETAPQATAAPVEPPPADPPPPPDDPDDAKPGRIRIDKLSDARTREIVAFLSRNHDATYEDALAATEPTKPAPPAPAPIPAGPDLNALTARVTDLQAQIKAAGDPLSDTYDAEKVSDLRDQLDDAKIDVRFARREAEQQAASVQQRRTDARSAATAKAVEMCPEINDPTSPQGREFARLVAQYQASNDPILHNDNCARLIALDVMDATGYVRQPVTAPPSTPSVSAATPAPVAPAATPAAPRAPIPVVRNPAPVSVSAPGSSRLTPAPTVSPAAFLKAIDEADDVSDLIGALSSGANNARKKFSMD